MYLFFYNEMAVGRECENMGRDMLRERKWETEREGKNRKIGKVSHLPSHCTFTGIHGGKQLPQTEWSERNQDIPSP